MHRSFSSTNGRTYLKILLKVKILHTQEHNLEAAKFLDFISYSLNIGLTSGSSITFLTSTSILSSISSPLKFIILSINFAGLFITFYAFFHGSPVPNFSPRRIITVLAVITTPNGGYPMLFISVIWFFFKQFTASLALSNAGKASARAISASDFSFSALLAAALVFSSSMLARFYSSSAIADSAPTLSINTSVSALLYSTSIILT